MKQEIQAASQHWSELLDYQIPFETKLSFQQNLNDLLIQKFNPHWHVDTPERGQALREIVYDPKSLYVEPVLVEAAAAAGFDFVSCFGAPRGVRMWVDPGEVEVTFTEAPYRKRVIYQQQSRSSSPSMINEQASYQQSECFYPDENTVYYYPENNYYPQDSYYSYQPEYYTEMYNPCNTHTQQINLPHQYSSLQHGIEAGM